MTHLHALESVEGWIAFDIPQARVSSGGTRLAADVSADEAALLARCMTYKYGSYGIRGLGGAKACLRPGADRATTMRRYCAEIRPLVESFRFLTGPDLGTSPDDFRGLELPVTLVDTPSEDDLTLGDVLTARGVVAAIEATAASVTTADGLRGLRIAVEGFGRIGRALARQLSRAGARIVGVSTLEGAVYREDGLPVAALIERATSYGDGFVHGLGCPVHSSAALYGFPADVLVPGGRTGSLTAALAAELPVRMVVPVANAPYRIGVPELLRRAGVLALPDFVCNAGATLGHQLPAGATPQTALEAVARQVTQVVRELLADPAGPWAAACERARQNLRRWVPSNVPIGTPPLVGQNGISIEGPAASTSTDEWN
jgi:glutamate dehydrogenase/leucine dehydrogenase